MMAMILGLALLIDWVWGWNDWFIRRIGHPVIWAGRAISALEIRLNTGNPSQKKRKGALCSIALIALAAMIGQIVTWGVFWLFPKGLAIGVLVIFSWPMLASRALYDHVKAVYDPLAQNDLEGARLEISKIVGRNPESLDENAIRRAAIESLAENSSDGVVAPLFWGLIFGLAGLYAYKMINTLDSMIAYRNARYENYGFFAAKIDDVANFIPARLTALLLLLGRWDFQEGKSLKNDANAHRSPNGGWPEAAMARLINARLSGPRIYDGIATDDPWINAHAPDPDNAAFSQALKIFSLLIDKLLIMLMLMAIAYGVFLGM